MPSITSVTLETVDPVPAERFYATAFDLGERVRVRASLAPTSGFRGFTLSMMVPRPADVDRLVGAATDAGATPVKQVSRSLWGYGGVVQAPDGTIWKVATAAKADAGPATGRIDDLVLLLGSHDVAASKRFYVERGLSVARSFGRRYVEFTSDEGSIKLALYGRRALAKDAGVASAGTGSSRLSIGGDLGFISDPDGFVWEDVAAQAQGDTRVSHLA
jgi:catechol 2,3-dioxygenase-like lactoylglutathione lyase family enzyme